MLSWEFKHLFDTLVWNSLTNAEEGKLSPDDELRKRAISRLNQKRDFGVHLRAYIAVNVLLVGVWALTGGPFWPVFPIVGWGIGLSVHAWNTYGRKPFSEEQIRREAQRLEG